MTGKEIRALREADKLLMARVPRVPRPDCRPIVIPELEPLAAAVREADHLADLSDEAIKAMDLYWEPDIERIKHYLAVAYERGQREVGA
jgi:hypothetical protein